MLRENERTRVSTFDCDHQPNGSQPDTVRTTELIDDMNSKITYYQTVREDASIQIQKLIRAKGELIDTCRA